MKRIIIGLLLLIAVFGTAWWFWMYREVMETSTTAPVEASKPLYHCPMHPTYVSDRPGECPICGMKLVQSNDSEGDGEHDREHHDHTNHDRLHSAHGEAPSDYLEDTTAPSPSQQKVKVQDYATLKIAEDRQQKLGMITAPVKYVKIEKEIRTVGRVSYNEAKVHHVHTRFEGFIEDIFVNYIGQKVSKGERLFNIYSPEVYATFSEYLIALRAERSQKVRSADINLVESAKRRLLLWDIDQREIEKLNKVEKPPRTVTIYSSIQGYVIAKTAYHGMKITPSDVVYDIADLSDIWIIADVYENDLPFVAVGDEAVVNSPYVPGYAWSGKVSYIYPDLDEKTRTVRVRVELTNINRELKPEMFTDVVIKSSLGEKLVVPESAVITTGERKIVFVKKEEGNLEPREIVSGIQTQDYYEVVKGVSEGELVVIGANFLLDSESKLKASLNAMAGGHTH